MNTGYLQSKETWDFVDKIIVWMGISGSKKYTKYNTRCTLITQGP